MYNMSRRPCDGPPGGAPRSRLSLRASAFGYLDTWPPSLRSFRYPKTMKIHTYIIHIVYIIVCIYIYIFFFLFLFTYLSIYIGNNSDVAASLQACAQRVSPKGSRPKAHRAHGLKRVLFSCLVRVWRYCMSFAHRLQCVFRTKRSADYTYIYIYIYTH